MAKVFATNMAGKGLTSVVFQQIEKERFGGVKHKP